MAEPVKSETVVAAETSPPGSQPRPDATQTTAATHDPSAVFLGTGRRKESVARVRLTPGTGTIMVNERAYDEYFPREALRLAIRSPLLLTHQLGKYNVSVNVVGGGINGQAGAIRLGIARALSRIDEAHRVSLRGAGLLTRDPRMKERKKYGFKGARKRFQWTKR